MQQMLEGWRPREGARDEWIWRKDPFSVRGLYQQLRTTQSEDPAVLNACRTVWKQRLPHKVVVFVWTIARQPVLTRVRHRHLFSTRSALCMLCGEQEEDYEHLFFKCPIAIGIWGQSRAFRYYVKFSFLGYNTEVETRSRSRSGKKICGGMGHMATPQ